MYIYIYIYIYIYKCIYIYVHMYMCMYIDKCDGKGALGVAAPETNRHRGA